MMRRTMTVLAVLAVVGCRAPDARVGSERITLVPDTEGNLDYDFSRDGRLALSKTVVGRSAIFVANADASAPRRVSFGVWDNAPMWSPDGQWIAFRRDAGQQNDVVIVPSDSGQERIVAGTSATELLRGWLADGSGVLYVRAESRGLQPWVYRLADQSSERLFEVDGSVDLCAAPDGKSVVYTLGKDDKSTLWLFDLATEAHRQLTTEGFEVANRRCFSPDGGAIVYESRRTGTSDLWRLDIATGAQRQLTSDLANDVGGRWSPDGSRIVFDSNRGGQPDLWVLATGESDVQRVTDDAFEEWEQGWTPDGRGILARAVLVHQHLYSVPTAGGAALPLTSGDWDVGTYADVNSGVRLATLSADGSRVAYAGSQNGDADIWVVPIAGGEPRLVSGAPGHDGQPEWSPDGTRIAFSSVRSGNRDIWVAAAGADSSAPRQLTSWPGFESTPRWSPDGSVIAFLSTRESSGRDLWTMPVTGGTPRRLTKFGNVGDDVKWSVDGRSIVISAQADSASGEELYSVPVDGRPAKRIAPPTSRALNWSPDGREFASSHCALGYCVIEIRSPEGKLLRTLTTGDVVFETGLHWSHDGARVLVASQDLTSLAFNRVDIRPATGGGVGRILPGPLGSSVLPVGFGPGDSTAVVLAGAGATALQRITAPAPIKVP